MIDEITLPLGTKCDGSQIGKNFRIGRSLYEVRNESIPVRFARCVGRRDGSVAPSDLVALALEPLRKLHGYCRSHILRKIFELLLQGCCGQRCRPGKYRQC
ncbi:hypothetical protein [Rhizobium johnstonii]|uniref:hypothetical protein n=1 Tax=Rhizobium johnstonii TaxID=3019933 RepID=UPI003F9811F0